VLLDRGAHVVDHICWWLGGKAKVISSLNDAFGGGDAVAHIQFEHGQCLGEIKLSWLSSFPCRYLVQGKRGIVEGDVYDYQNIALTVASGSTKRLKLATMDKLGIGSQIVANFLAVVSHKEKPLIDGRDVLDSVQFIEECYGKAARFPMPWYEVLEGGHDS
jgi:predicted dehydrogenase